MLRSCYLATLTMLQLALVIQLAPPLALALRADALAGLPADGLPAMLQLFAMALSVAGSAVALVFPGVALARHKRAGAMRFLGVPRWAIAAAVTGVGVLVAATVGLGIAFALPADVRVDVVLVSRPAVHGGLALAAAGVLCGELLRRSVPTRAAKPVMRRATGRTEVTYPPELRTHALPAAAPHLQRRSG